MANNPLCCVDSDNNLAAANLYIVQLENQARQIGVFFDGTFCEFRRAITFVQGAETALFLDDRSTYVRQLDQATETLVQAEKMALQIGTTIKGLIGLFAKSPTPDDYVVRRESVFAEIDYCSYHRWLAKHRAVWEGPCWDPLVDAFKSGGCCAALRLLEKRASSIARQIQKMRPQIKKARAPAGQKALEVLHENILASAALHLALSGFSACCVSFTLIVWKASTVLRESDERERG